MNIAFFLLPKNEIICIPLECTMRQAMEKMEYHRYTAVPIIDREGKYVGTITEGDLLWKIKNTPGMSMESAEKIFIKDIPRRLENKAVSINAHMEDLLFLAVQQNFVPVVDDAGIFIGIIRRREILGYCAREILKKEQ